MKNIFKVLFSALALAMVFSCEKREEDMVQYNQTGNASFTLSAPEIVLDETKADDAAITLNWVNPVFTPAMVTKNQLQFGVKGENFANSVVVDLPANVTTYDLTHSTLNTVFTNLGLSPNQATALEVRLRTVLGSNEANSVYSATTNLTATTYKSNPDLVYPKINMPGGYAGASGYSDWSPAATANLFSPKKNDVYYGFVWMNVNTEGQREFKFTKGESWDVNKGDDGTFTGKLSDGGPNCKVELGTNTYYVKVDWAGNTYSLEKANFGIIGAATPTGWDSDTDFTFNTTTKKFEIASIALTGGEIFKFRANDSWNFKFQPSSDDEVLVSGTEVQTYFSAEGTVNGDPNYKVETTGNYKIELDLHNSAYYSIKVTKL